MQNANYSQQKTAPYNQSLLMNPDYSIGCTRMVRQVLQKYELLLGHVVPVVLRQGNSTTSSSKQCARCAPLLFFRKGVIPGLCIRTMHTPTFITKQKSTTTVLKSQQSTKNAHKEQKNKNQTTTG